ncbi:hypothetical protein ABF87_09160 [Nitrosomonas sp. JL21]|uniref:glycine zipper domain-containing protein n=1 Tax=Nitrosomonas sp. JL21 TaxID=153949 RepID=UPI001367F98B|nr:glycine zipper domain-containing protein [Nitrosomonas sp. JL21]MBL8496804.1 hypothetical protein [Nitrosomonas sp.]MBL8498444.1 hypothetical protein [Nitrosomonas sp.]MXS78122.1 hypothetical protein [Nitrosomonas sp. JL21]
MEGGIKRHQPDLSFDELYKQAQVSAPMLENIGQSILDRLKTQNPEIFETVIFEMGPIKTRDRALDKISGDYGGDLRQIKDLVRGRFVVDTPEQITAIKQAILEKLDVDSMTDKYAEPSSTTGYRDLNTKIALENDHIAEIQIQQRDMLRVNKPTHNLMEEIQKIERHAEIENRTLTEEEIFKRDALRNQAKELHNAAAHDGNLNSLVKPELREQFTHKGELDAKGSALGKLAETFGKLGKNGGVIAGVALGTLSGVFTLAAGGSKAKAAQVVYEAAVPYGETQIDLAHGDLLAVEKSAIVETASNIGSLGGAAAGAAIGTMILPGIGTAIGAGIGALSGGVSTGYITEKIHDNYAQTENETVRLAHEASESLKNAVQRTKQLLAGWFDEKPVLDAGAAFNALPGNVKPDMPPEVAALVEVKASRELFEKSFAEIEQHGGLSEVQAYIEAHPLEARQPVLAVGNHPVHYVHSPVPGLR